MPIYKRCTRCKKRLPSGTKCPCMKRVYPKYSAGSDKYKDFYKTSEWVIMREKIKDLYNGLDIYSYYILNRIEYGSTVHHITELKENWDRRLDPSNLIYLTESNHQLIHRDMRKSAKEKADIQALLYELKDRYVKEFNSQES